MGNSDEVTAAIAIAAAAHLGQTYGTEDYFESHVCKVADNIVEMADDQNPTQDELVVAYLHDVIEDTKVDAFRLEELGISSHNVASVERLTKKDGEGTTSYLEWIRQDPVATKVKIADALVNLTKSVHTGDFERIKKYTFYIQFLTGAWDNRGGYNGAYN